METYMQTQILTIRLEQSFSISRLSSIIFLNVFHLSCLHVIPKAKHFFFNQKENTNYIKICIFSTQFTAREWPKSLKSAGVMSPNLQRWTAATTKIFLITRCTGTGSVQGRPWPSLFTQLQVESQTMGGSLKPSTQPSKRTLRPGVLLWKTCSLRTTVCIFVPSANTVMREAEQLNKNWLTINLVSILQTTFWLLYIFPLGGTRAQEILFTLTHGSTMKYNAAGVDVIEELTVNRVFFRQELNMLTIFVLSWLIGNHL